ncbi:MULTISPECIES: GntR family transcriptional regulator [Pseudoxanthomonas]|uniref:GntR family transcriptional regulator n=1 Tax=Pseudoxanthomonas TaxID=83618 RepID=UPI001390C04C|nr:MULTISPECIES: GntR family transcriptional regulator [Pseudoxanthomonas]KAF1698209.1 GntR family transcriptional regulator [Pseudoxanthomonas jiangsuensis]MCR6687607.1 GntR family transcriptional regulator [Pseudoxanthomonas sp.]
MSDIQWSDGAPIYRQLKDRVIAMMLDGILKPGEALPSVRQVAAEYQLNPITVSRAYQELADEGLVEKRRGLGMFVTEEASKQLRSSERERFLNEEWPVVAERIQRLGLSMQDLLNSLGKNHS